MNTFNSPAEAITAVPSQDIGRWIARINLVNYALQQPHSVDLGDAVGYTYQGLIEDAKSGEDWQASADMEDLMVYELKPSIGFDKVVNGPNRYANDPRYCEGKDISMDVQRTVLRSALGRLGLYETEEPHVPIAATAALHYMRGNIKDPIDRSLYERSEEIDEAAAAIEMLAKARETIRQVQRPTSSGWVTEDQVVSVYAVAHRGNPAKAQELGLDPDSPVDPWWQELQRDLGRIDEASGNL
jgi:hypothetical protein